MKRTLRHLGPVLLLAAAAILAWWRPWQGPAPSNISGSHRHPAPPTAPEAPPAVPPATPPVTAPPSPPESAAPAASDAGRQRALEAIDNLDFCFRDFRANLGGNPVGTNAEITAALLGDNPKQLKLELPAGSSLNQLGELCDPWGSPWFLHQLSASRMEIRSAGADLTLFSQDDFVR